jgi:DNA-binding NtrC family response regulator
MNKQRILIVEDETSLSDIILHMLEFFGHEGITANNGITALKIIDKEAFDCIIMDLTLPDFSGIELYKKFIRKNPAYRERIIFTSGHSITNELSDLIKKDHLSFLPKPFTVDQFQSMIGTVLK